MRRLFQAASLAVCLAVATGAPRGFALAALAIGLGMARVAYAQQQPAMTFDVVSIKRNRSGEQGGRNALDPGAYVGINVTLRRMIALAYAPLPNAQIIGGPDWLNSERFDVQARFGGSPSRPQVQQMMRAMLADRFRLQTHSESRPTRVFSLGIARRGVLGPALKRSELDCSNPANRRPATGGVPSCAFHYTDGLIRGRGVTLDQIAAELDAGRTVVNRTELQGFYDVELRWSPDSTRLPADDAPPTLATALREQLGLRIDSMTLPMEYLIIDNADRPAEN